MRYRTLHGITAGLGLLLAAGCSGGDPAPAAGAQTPAADPGTTVTVARLAFAPDRLTVPVGTTVTWRSEEPIGHTVTSGEVTGVDATTGLRAGEKPDGKFDGQLSGTGSTTSYRFATAGTYSYFCSIHDGMNALVVVT